MAEEQSLDFEIEEELKKERKIREAECRKKFNAADVDKSGYLDGKELRALATSQFQEWSQQKKWVVFDKYSDKDIQLKFEGEELEKILDKFDQDKDNKITFEEYFIAIERETKEIIGRKLQRLKSYGFKARSGSYH